jgi:putative SOS response-associated peptidase YedK
MCGRFTSGQRREAIAERFQVAPPDAYSERYNLAPTLSTGWRKERRELGRLDERLLRMRW